MSDPGDHEEQPDGARRRWLRVRIVANYVLQIAGDPRWWPRDLPKRRGSVLGREIAQAEAATWPPVDATERLRGLADAQFLEAKFWYLVVTYLYVAAAILAAVAFALHEGRGQHQYLTISAVACQIVAAITRFRAARLQALAHEADWRALIMDGCGPSRRERNYALKLENLISDSARARAGALPGYFANTERRGYRRLALRAPNKKRFWDAVVVDGGYGETFGQ